jgi:hypothetical protein
MRLFGDMYDKEIQKEEELRELAERRAKRLAKL